MLRAGTILFTLNILLCCKGFGQIDTPLYNFAVIGDYGTGDARELEVAKVVDNWQPSFIITAGDNIYIKDTAKVGESYLKYIHGHRFYPCPGNHDFRRFEDYKAFMNPAGVEYFNCNKKEVNYYFEKDLIRFYSITSYGRGLCPGKIFPATVKNIDSLQKSNKAPFSIIYFHHPPYASARASHRGSPKTRLPFRQYGFDMVLTGHNHFYERFTDTSNNMPYVTIGCSGKLRSKNCGSFHGDKNIRHDICTAQYYGAVKAIVYAQQIRFEFYAVLDKNGKKLVAPQLIDTISISRERK